MQFKSLIFILIIVLFTSCSTDSAVDEIKIPVINEMDYLSADIISQTENQVRFKETISFSNAYPHANMIDLTTLNKPRDDANLSGVDNQGNVYYVAERSDSKPTGAIYSYNPFSKKWNTLVETDNNHNCNYIFANEKYLLWMEDQNANWLKTSLHLLNLDTMKDIKFYEHTVDPNTKLTFAWQFSTPVLINDTVYFDDIVNVNKDEIYEIKVFSYSISKNKVKEVAKDAKWPMEYQNNAAWLKKSQDQKNSIFFSSQQNKNLFKTETRLGTVFTSHDDIIIANDYMSQAFYDTLTHASNSKSEFTDTVKDPAISSYGIKLLVNDNIQPVIVINKGNITNPVSNGDLIAWRGLSVGTPVLYSYNMNKLIEFDHLSLDSVFDYGFMLSQNYAILSCATEKNEQYTYMWKLKK